jgi:hypothetical protein
MERQVLLAAADGLVSLYPYLYRHLYPHRLGLPWARPTRRWRRAPPSPGSWPGSRRRRTWAR